MHTLCMKVLLCSSQLWNSATNKGFSRFLLFAKQSFGTTARGWPLSKWNFKPEVSIFSRYYRNLRLIYRNIVYGPLTFSCLPG